MVPQKWIHKEFSFYFYLFIIILFSYLDKLFLISYDQNIDV